MASSQVKLKTAEAEAKQRQAEEAKAKKSASKNPWQPAAEAQAEETAAVAAAVAAVPSAVPASEAAEPEKREKKKARKESEAERKAREKKEKEAQEQFCIEPTRMALFQRTTAEAAAGPEASGEASGSPEDDARGVWLRYIKVSTSCWSEHEIRHQMDELRAPDEEREVVREAARSQAEQLLP